MFRHVLCVYPYRVEIAGSNHFPPLGLEIVAAVIEKHARAIDIVDLRKESNRTVDFIRPETDLVVFSVNWDLEGRFVREEINSVPPHVMTLVGGRHATEDPEKWMVDCPNVDVLVRGDGEEIVDELARGEPLEKIAGLSFRRDGELVHNPARLPGPVADDVYPNRRLRRYTYSVELDDFETGITLDSVAASRGCPHNCTYCSFSRNPWGAKRSWSARSPEAVVRELEEIDAKAVVFTDDNFTHDMDRVGKICDLIMAAGIRKRYLVNARLEVAKRPDVLCKMARAGFSMLLLGIESTQDRTLRSMRKGFNTKRIREYFQVLRRMPMLTHGYFIIGNIGETEEEMLYVARFARELGVDTLGLSHLRNSPYSGIVELVAATPGYHVAPDGKVYSDRYSNERLRQIRRRIYRRFMTAGQILHVLKKALRNEIVTPWMLARLSWFLVRKALWRRRRRKARLKRQR